MLRGRKPQEETRHELIIWGLVLIVGAILFLTTYEQFPSLMLFIPGLILLGSAIFQDLQAEWSVGWFSYGSSILMVALGLGGIINTLLAPEGSTLIPWWIIAVVLFGSVLIVKSVFDPTPTRRDARLARSDHDEPM